MHTWLIWKSEDVLLASLRVCRIIQGADWWLEEIADTYQESHEIREQRLVNGKVLIQTVKRPRDWVGQNYLEVREEPVTIRKQDAKGVWMQRGNYEVVHWFSEGEPTELEAWTLRIDTR
jgi:hypothetical protein